MANVQSEKVSSTEMMYLDICRELNMDKETERTSWRAYENISKNFTLEGDPKHWFCCSLYTGCREAVTPTVGNSTAVVKGNCVSLTKLLRSCHISIFDFFVKIKKWIDLTSSPQHFLTQVERLERSFGVSFVLYQKYNETFEKLFVTPTTEKRSKKAKPGKCSSSKLYDFCWCLFLCAKGEDPRHTVDIVTSFHLLLCCIDLVFLNAIHEKRDDIIYPPFIEKVRILDGTDFSPTKSPTCILKLLCEMHDAPYMECKEMKIYSFKKMIQKFMHTKTIQGETDSCTEIISNNNFTQNLKSLNNTYEQYVLSVGDFDERMFLNNVNLKKLDTDGEKVKHIQICASIKSLVPGTPFTRRHLLPKKDISEPISSATQSVKKLQSIAERTVEPDFLRNADTTISLKLETLISEMSKTFCQKYPTKSEAEKRFQLAKGIYYYLIEKIVRVEIKTKPNLDLKVLLQSEVLHSTLIACCLEIVIVAYNSHLKFPWILDCFNLQPFHFYKIIELVVSRHEDTLTRILIIHLNTIEEKCLDCLVWRSSSILWDVIKRNGSFPSWISVDNKRTNFVSGLSVIKKVDSSNLERSLLLSPMNSAYDCFKQSSCSESARRDLFNAGKAAAENPNNENNTRKGAGSLLLFCRKFYKLAFMRISDLCKELELRDDENLGQIWTLFEHSVVQTAELMQDRHLDQMIMCAIYVFIKVKDIREKTFTDIMRFYRNQPQAASHIYREVLITSEHINEDGETIPATYNDIIHFYNNVYVQKMTPYALEFGDRTKSKKNLLLSPHPPEKVPPPKQLLINHHLYIQPLEKTYVPESPNSITYEFCKSPAKDLEKINQLVRCGKRNLPFNDDESGAMQNNVRTKRPFIPRKMEDMIREKQNDEIRLKN